MGIAVSSYVVRRRAHPMMVTPSPVSSSALGAGTPLMRKALRSEVKAFHGPASSLHAVIPATLGEE
jgi:hypothetical protein